jgi:protein SCO1/2
VQLNAVLNALRDLDWTAGEDFRMVTISIDPDETSELAAAKRKTYLNELGRGEVDWNFLVGTQENITQVADAIGFRYVYEPKTEQYAHPAVLTFLSPDLIISRYLYGLSYDSRDLKFSLIESASGNVGSTVDKIILSCFIYDTTVGRYTPTAFGIMRLGGAVSALALGLFTFVMWRKEPSHEVDGRNV